MKALAVVLWAALLAGCSSALQPLSPLGRDVRVSRKGGSVDGGELLAVSADSVWIAMRSGNVSVPLEEVRRVNVKVGRLTWSDGAVYGAGVGLAAGVALLSACSQVEGAECGGVLPAFLVSGFLWGAIAGLSYEASSHRRFTRQQWESLRAYARFPQGLPADVPRRPRRPHV